MMYALGNYYFSSKTTQNSINLFKITDSFIGTEIRVEISETVSSSMIFKYLDITNQHIGGCFSVNSSTMASGYFYYND